MRGVAWHGALIFVSFKGVLFFVLQRLDHAFHSVQWVYALLIYTSYFYSSSLHAVLERCLFASRVCAGVKTEGRITTNARVFYTCFGL